MRIREWIVFMVVGIMVKTVDTKQPPLTTTPPTTTTTTPPPPPTTTTTPTSKTTPQPTTTTPTSKTTTTSTSKSTPTPAAAAASTGLTASKQEPTTTPPSTSPSAATTPTTATTTQTPQVTSATSVVGSTVTSDATTTKTSSEVDNNGTTANNTSDMTTEGSTETSSSTESSLPTPTKPNVTSTAVPATSPTTTAVPTTTTVASTSTVPPTTPPKPKFLINEFTYSGYFSGGTSFFVEVLMITGQGEENVTVVVFTSSDGTDSKCEAVLHFNDGWTPTKKLQFKNVTVPTETVRNAVFVALFPDDVGYNCSDIDNSMLNSTDLMDVMIVSKSFDFVPSAVLDKILPKTEFQVLLADEKKLKNIKELSVSRCENTTKNPGSFILSSVTPGSPNQCTLNNSATGHMTLNASGCSDLQNQTTEMKLKNYIAKTVGNYCDCGFSPFLIRKMNFDCKCMTYTWSLHGVTKTQIDGVKSQYDAMIESRTSKCFENNTLCITKQATNCDHLPAKAGNGSNIKVTIGVVVACIVVFLVIVAIVIIYIRRKRRGILQFRMMRLDEDDDDLIGGDTDDFVGGQDASFRNPTYSQFK